MGLFGRSVLAEQTPVIIEYDSFYKTVAFTAAATNIAANAVLVTNSSKRVLTSTPSTGYLYWNGSAFVWQSPTGSGLPGGNTYDIQYNDGVGGFGGLWGYTSPCSPSGVVYDLVTQYGVVQSFSEVGEGSSGYLYHDGYGNYYWNTPCTGGDMWQSTYDTDYDGIVENADSWDGHSFPYNATGYLYNDGYGNLSWQSCGSGSQTPWTSNIDAAGYNLTGLGDGTRTLGLCDGTYAINAVGASLFTISAGYAVEGYNNSNVSGAGGYFHSVAGSVYLADLDNNYAINASGDVYISGKITSTGGYDPPYVLYDPQTREQITTRVADEIPEEKLGGAVLFFNKDTQQLEVKIGERYFKITMEGVWQ